VEDRPAGAALVFGEPGELASEEGVGRGRHVLPCEAVGPAFAALARIVREGEEVAERGGAHLDVLGARRCEREQSKGLEPAAGEHARAILFRNVCETLVEVRD